MFMVLSFCFYDAQGTEDSHILNQFLLLLGIYFQSRTRWGRSGVSLCQRFALLRLLRLVPTCCVSLTMDQRSHYYLSRSDLVRLGLRNIRPARTHRKDLRPSLCLQIFESTQERKKKKMFFTSLSLNNERLGKHKKITLDRSIIHSQIA